MNAREHYQSHLGNFYAWMVGDFDKRREEQENFFRDAGIVPYGDGVAFDLGCGHGLQSVSLARLGFTVEAVDFNEQLLSDLKHRIQHFPIRIHQADILDFLKHTPLRADVVVCMGDTLTHLDRKSDVYALISEAFQKLKPQGVLVLSFRELQEPADATSRIIPVRSDAHRIHTCVLEFDHDFVRVFDILHEREGNTWEQRVSWYPKLRLTVQEVRDQLTQNGFQVDVSHTIHGMHYLVARKP
jgi:2-polyprenyl-3-methyl-5-hydroxy-6-metoxy-1,4-benzoquinol methylase